MIPLLRGVLQIFFFKKVFARFINSILYVIKLNKKLVMKRVGGEGRERREGGGEGRRRGRGSRKGEKEGRGGGGRREWEGRDK